MNTTRRGLFGLFAGAAVAPIVLKDVSLAELFPSSPPVVFNRIPSVVRTFEYGRFSDAFAKEWALRVKEEFVKHSKLMQVLNAPQS